MLGKIPAAIAFLVLTCAPAGAEQPGSLDLIPDDAVVGVSIRSVGDLKKKGDELVAKMQLRIPIRPTQDIDNLLQFLGIQAGLDSENAMAVVLAHPKYIGAKDAANQDLLVLVVPFADRGKMAGNFGLTAETLKPDSMVTLPGKHVSGFFGKFVYTHKNLLFLGDHEKAILSVAKAKPLRQTLTAAQQRVPGEADILVHFQPRAWEPVWRNMLKELDQRFNKLGDESERQIARQLVTSLQEVRFVQGSLRIDAGLGLSLATIFPPDAKGAARNFLTALQAGPGTSELTGLPAGSVVAAQAARGDGAQNAVHAKVILEGLLLDWFWSKKLVAAMDRHTFLGVFTEVWQQLKGSRFAVYRNADESRLGLFSVLAILDTEDAKGFLTTLRGLARLADPKALKLSGTDAREDDVAQVEKLVLDLGDKRFRVRTSASTRLSLIGEPALPYLEKALKATDPEVRRRAETIKQQIVDAARARRQELLSKDLTQNLRPAFAFQSQAEMRAGLRIDLLRMKLDDKDAAATTQLQQLFGPDWSKIRLAVVGKQVIVLLGSDAKLLDATVINLMDKRVGWADNKVLAAFTRHADAARKAEFHISVRTALALSKAEDLKNPTAFSADPPMTSLALTVAPERLQLDVWLPAMEFQELANWRGW